MPRNKGPSCGWRGHPLQIVPVCRVELPSLQKEIITAIPSHSRGSDPSRYCFTYTATRFRPREQHSVVCQMSLVSGPGRGGAQSLPDDLSLVVDKHVSYIQALDTVR
jgi:hypothetical protein